MKDQHCGQGLTLIGALTIFGMAAGLWIIILLIVHWLVGLW